MGKSRRSHLPGNNSDDVMIRQTAGGTIAVMDTRCVRCKKMVWHISECGETIVIIEWNEMPWPFRQRGRRYGNWSSAQRFELRLVLWRRRWIPVDKSCMRFQRKSNWHDTHFLTIGDGLRMSFGGYLVLFAAIRNLAHTELSFRYRNDITLRAGKSQRLQPTGAWHCAAKPPTGNWKLLWMQWVLLNGLRLCEALLAKNTVYPTYCAAYGQLRGPTSLHRTNMTLLPVTKLSYWLSSTLKFIDT